MGKILKIGILFHPLIDTAAEQAQSLTEYLTGRGIAVWQGSSWESEKARSLLVATDILLSIGGDGTILRAAQVVMGTPIPVVGINLGHLGFLTEFPSSSAPDGLSSLLDGGGWIDERNTLEATIVDVNGNDGRSFFALNDIVVARGAVARVIKILVAINDEPFTIYTADGAITATATGSTGYSLSAGGPILYPRSQDYLLTPLLPHLGLSQSLVLPEKASVKFRVTTPYAATLSIDGHINLPLASESTVRIKTGPHKIRFLRMQPESTFFSGLAQKLKGKRNVL